MGPFEARNAAVDVEITTPADIRFELNQKAQSKEMPPLALSQETGGGSFISGSTQDGGICQTHCSSFECSTWTLAGQS